MSNSLSSIIPVGSKPLTGSSNIKNSGSPNRAIANANRCFIPKEKSFTFFFFVLLSPTSSNVLEIHFFSGIPRCTRCISKFCFAVISLYNAGISTVQPILARSYRRFSVFPNKETTPLLWKANPVNIRIRVDFPAPFSPISPYISPRLIERFTFCNTWKFL